MNEVGVDTSAADSIKILEQFRALDVELVLFAGGDGTARDVAKGIGLTVPVVGIPAGVKIYSPVFAITPEAAGRMAYDYLSESIMGLVEKEVI